MKGYFAISKARYNCNHILRLGEVCMYQYDELRDLWYIVIGDGKTLPKDLPPLANYDIYERVTKLEEEIQELKNARRV